MQPYIFPYLGYFQLINAVDKFVIYDDVGFIKQGWINRNYIAAEGRALLFTVPLEQASSGKLINETKLDPRSYRLWQNKFLQTLHQNYKKAPFFDSIFPPLKQIFEAERSKLTDLLVDSLLFVSNYLSLQTQFVTSSVIYNNKDLKGQDRILDICKKEQATEYYNLMGGQDLYSKSDFLKSNVVLNFIRSKQELEYNQGKIKNFIPRLSIIDVLMYNSKEKVRFYLDNYETA
jgi:hypothetical protein